MCFQTVAVNLKMPQSVLVCDLFNADIVRVIWSITQQPSVVSFQSTESTCSISFLPMKRSFRELFVFYPWMRENQTTCYFHTMLFIKTNQRIKEQIMANTPLTIIVRFLFLESRLGKPHKNQNHLAQLNRITIKWSFLLPNTLWVSCTLKTWHGHLKLSRCN